MNFRVFTSFIIILIDIFLWFLPYQAAVYDFRTDSQIDRFPIATGVGVFSANISLSKALYNDDVGTLFIYSDLDTDFPTLISYNGTTRRAMIGNITENTTRTLEVNYDAPSFDPSGAISNFMDVIPWFWMLILVMFPLAALVYIWWGKFTGME
jgi:hypothetical protein